MEEFKDTFDYRHYDFIDRYEYVIANPDDRVGILDVAELFVGPDPKWVKWLFALRNRIAALFDLNTQPDAAAVGGRWEPGSQAGIFRVFGRTANEVILGEDDTHLNLRVLLSLKQTGESSGEKCVAIQTLVHLNNRVGGSIFSS